MPRRLRFIPEGGAVVEVTGRTIHGRMLLKPNRRLNEAIVGTLARGKRHYGVRIHAVVFLSNHYHLLIGVDDAKQLSSFMGYVNAKVAREAGRVWSWREKLWGRRYESIVTSDEETAQLDRMRYLLSHGVKENLVARCQDWPGIHCAEALVTGRSLKGFWFDRTKEYAARQRGADIGVYTYAEPETLKLDPLPCWAHLDQATYRARIGEIVAQVEAEAEAARKRRGIYPLGVEAIRRQRAHDRTERLKRSPAPAFHTATKHARQRLREAYQCFVIAYREAADRLRDTDLSSLCFPPGSFPPAPPFIAAPLLMPR